MRFLKYCCFLFVFLGVYSQSLEAQSVIDLKSNRELFVDYYLIEKMEGAGLVMHQPRDEGVVLKFDKEWEGQFSGYCTVIKDQAKYRLYYRGLPKPGLDGSTAETTCYAESVDGINWTKPKLGLHVVNGTNENNIVIANDAPYSHNFSPFLDTNPGVKANERYKAMAGTEKSGLVAYVSADGIKWRKLKQDPVFTDGLFDSQNVAFWSENEQQYVCYFRTWTGDGYSGKRTVSRTTSLDFINWSEPKFMDFGNTPLEHLYTNQTHAYYRAPQLYVAIAARFMPNRQVLTDEAAAELNVNPKYYKDCSDVVLMTSRGSNLYDRTFMESFIRPGLGLQNWVSRSNYPALNVVETGPAEMSLYVNQDYAQPSAHLRRYSMRLDGFSSIRSGYFGGMVTTRPFKFLGSELYINYSTSAAGEIKIEVLDVNGIPIPGFQLDDCQEIIGNEINRKVKWSDKSLKELEGQTILLRIQMKDADLFSLKFE